MLLTFFSKTDTDTHVLHVFLKGTVDEDNFKMARMQVNFSSEWKLISPPQKNLQGEKKRRF